MVTSVVRLVVIRCAAWIQNSQFLIGFWPIRFFKGTSEYHSGIPSATQSYDGWEVAVYGHCPPPKRNRSRMALEDQFVAMNGGSHQSISYIWMRIGQMDWSGMEWSGVEWTGWIDIKVGEY